LEAWLSVNRLYISRLLARTAVSCFLRFSLASCQAKDDDAGDFRLYCVIGFAEYKKKVAESKVWKTPGTEQKSSKKT